MTTLPILPTNQRSRRAVSALTLAVCAIVLVAFARLIPLGPWYDEWFTIGHIRDQGLTYVRNRLIGWSPRPFSELCVYIYAQAVIHWGRPLVTPALACAWMLLGAATLLPGLLARRGLVAAAVLGCLLLLGHPVEEVFYWPIAAFAYMPTLAGAVLILALDWAGIIGRPGGRAAMVGALLIAALSSEVGAMFCCVYSVLAGVILAAVNRDRSAVWLALPLAAALTVLYLLTHGRAQIPGEVFGNPTIAHHPVAAMMAAMRTFAWQLLQSDPARGSPRNIVIAIATKLLFFAGIYLTIPLAPVDRTLSRQLLRAALAIAVIVSAFMVLVTAYGQFGMDCCQRHGTIRQCFILIGLGTLATIFAAWARPSGQGVLGGLLLLAALVLPACDSARSVLSDIRRASQFAEERTALWQSGTQPASVMVVPQIQPGRVVGGRVIVPGTYTPNKLASSELADWMMSFFKKTEARFQPP